MPGLAAWRAGRVTLYCRAMAPRESPGWILWDRGAGAGAGVTGWVATRGVDWVGRWGLGVTLTEGVERGLEVGWEAVVEEGWVGVVGWSGWGLREGGGTMAGLVWEAIWRLRRATW